MKQKILITGAGGYIGSVASSVFLDKGYEVIGFDNFTTGYEAPLELLKNRYPNTFRYYKGDLRTDLPDVFTKEKNIEAVVHYAASCLVDESMKNPFKYFDNNVGGTNKLLQTMTEYGIKHIVFSSTCAVYGEAQYMPIDEKHPLKPSQPYGVSKMMVEQIIDWYARLKGIKYVILRYFNVCGATDDGLIGDSKKPSTLLMQNAVRGVLGIEPFYLTCPEVDTPDKTPIRDYVNVVDLNEAHLKAIEYIFKSNTNEIINLGTGSGNSVMEIVNKVQEGTGVKFETKKTTPREGDDAKKIANIKKAQTLLEWTPKRSLSDSVKSLVRWYTEHPNGWDH